MWSLAHLRHLGGAVQYDCACPYFWQRWHCNESGVLPNLNSNGQSQQFVFIEYLLGLFTRGQTHDHQSHGRAATAPQSNNMERARSPLLKFFLNLRIRKVAGNSPNHSVDVPFRRERKNVRDERDVRMAVQSHSMSVAADRQIDGGWGKMTRR
ncbi:unnamed protein product [Acanthoscelides obtectus]|uniref:Uncharacterized protein n=1 Tax=Acanthoscelides obtectus TaxID=200917 RepID=A0A9P0K309_ACAOB|nr:unnamed protein product [Acanthoscelides obtectus]CAK1634259.1 hypothetical protein AOBTE_LOCUS8699 [Acanthoscelides obtectus]